jgi:hypothetical protein
VGGRRKRPEAIGLLLACREGQLRNKQCQGKLDLGDTSGSQTEDFADVSCGIEGDQESVIAARLLFGVVGRGETGRGIGSLGMGMLKDDGRSRDVDMPGRVLHDTARGKDIEEEQAYHKRRETLLPPLLSCSTYSPAARHELLSCLL